MPKLPLLPFRICVRQPDGKVRWYGSVANIGDGFLGRWVSKPLLEEAPTWNEEIEGMFRMVWGRSDVFIKPLLNTASKKLPEAVAAIDTLFEKGQKDGHFKDFLASETYKPMVYRLGKNPDGTVVEIADSIRVTGS